MQAWLQLSRSLREEVWPLSHVALRRCYSTPPESRSRPQVPARREPASVSQLPTRLSPPHKDRDLIDWKPNEYDGAVDVDELLSYPFLNQLSMSKYRDRPTRFRALVRDFIDDSLYNPFYGYFSTQAEILDFGVSEAEGFAFNELKNDIALDREMAKKYGALSTAVAIPGKGQDAARQIWHTPTELFKPWYARVVARYLVAEYKATLLETGDDLIIYELGAGNGTLMRGILDYLAEAEPEAYSRTRYHIIEISPRLARIQRERAERGRHADKLEINNVSIFDWKRPVQEPCFFLAFEVLDNFAHDVVRYRLDTCEPMQCFVAGDERGDLRDYYEPVVDPLIVRFLNTFQYTFARANKPHVSKWLERSPSLRHLRSSIPFAGNLGPPIFIPTKALMFLDVLRTCFPQHSLLVSDFDRLPDAVKGVNGPVVQTRYKGMTVPCTTYLVSPGFFDIFFPTDFGLLSELYALLMSSKPYSTSHPSSFDFFERVDTVKPLQVASHREFCQRWAEPGKTKLRDGNDPLLDMYANAAFASSMSQPLAS